MSHDIDPRNALWLEPGAFENPGGWVLDTQFVETMGGAFLLALGRGRPVRDAVTTACFPRAGAYRMWVYTKDWVAPWKKGCAPGLFRIEIDGDACDTVFGNAGKEWNWQDGGIVTAGDNARVALHD
jgi:hypothetical protein